MAPLEASSGAAPVWRQRPPSTLLRAGVGRRRLRYHPVVWNRQWGAVALGADPGDCRLGPSWGAAAPLGTSSGAAAGRRLVARVDLVQVDSGRFWPGAVGLHLPRAEPSSGQVDEPHFRPHFASNFCDFGPASAGLQLRAKSAGLARIDFGASRFLVECGMEQ